MEYALEVKEQGAQEGSDSVHCDASLTLVEEKERSGQETSQIAAKRYPLQVRVAACVYSVTVGQGGARRHSVDHLGSSCAPPCSQCIKVALMTPAGGDDSFSHQLVPGHREFKYSGISHSL